MALFGNKQKAGGIADVIRCDEPSYLIWKWHPEGTKAGMNYRENSIRWGSSLRVKDGEAAVFFYNQGNGIQQDFIEGPYNGIIETQNFPVLSGLIGLYYRGDTPFQAEIYFINLAKIIQIPFAVPYFDLYDFRFSDIGVPVAVRGMLTFHISDYREFVKIHRLQGFDLDSFQKQIKDAMCRYTKGVITNISAEKSIPVVQIERQLPLINELVAADVKARFTRDFGIEVSEVDVSVIDIDKTSTEYNQLKAVTVDMEAATVLAQTEVNIKNLQEMQRINAENTQETLRIQREESQYAQRKQTQTSNMGAFQLEQQAAVGIAGAQALGQMGTNGATEISVEGGMNPAAMMTGIAMGGVVSQNIVDMMNGMLTGIN